MNKKIETILLSENENKLEKINEFLNDDFIGTVREIFVVLLNSIKSKSLLDINIIMSNIEKIVLNQSSNNFKIINNLVCETNHKMQELKKNCNEGELKQIKFRLVDLNRKMLNKKTENNIKSLYNFYHYLIFEEKNIDMVELVLKTEKNFLNKKDEFNNNLLYSTIDYYCSLSYKEQKEEVDYFYQIIILILKYEEDKLVKEDENIYLELLNRKFCKNKYHVQEIIDRFYEFYLIDSDKLEKKYNIYSKVHDNIIEEIKTFKYSLNARKIIPSYFITIDEENALCLDDAISLVKNKDGSYYYYIAITDIPSFIPYGTKTFYDAMKKIETLYLTDQIIEMYPHDIANNHCSLLPNIQKNAIVYRVLVDSSYNVDYDSLVIIPGIIQVNDRLTYRQVNKQENLNLYTAKMLEDLAMISFKLKSQNKVKEKYRRIENIINFDAKHHHSMFTDVSISANIIQESMLLVNFLAGKYFDDNGLVYIFRNLQFFDEKVVNQEVDRILKCSHSNLDINDQKKVLKMLKETMLNACYSTDNKGHQGLNYTHYSHSTSAARRFADSFNQYLTHEQVFNDITDERYYELENTAKEVVNYINMKKKENSKFESEYNYLNSKKLIRKR